MKKIILLSFLSLIPFSFQACAMAPDLADKDSKTLMRSESSASDSEDYNSYVPQLKSDRRCQGKGFCNTNSKPIKNNTLLKPDDIKEILKDEL